MVRSRMLLSAVAAALGVALTGCAPVGYPGYGYGGDYADFGSPYGGYYGGYGYPFYGGYYGGYGGYGGYGFRRGGFYRRGFGGGFHGGGFPRRRFPRRRLPRRGLPRRRLPRRRLPPLGRSTRAGAQEASQIAPPLRGFRVTSPRTPELTVRHAKRTARLVG